MIHAFMIQYEYAGEKNFANVVEYKEPSPVFYVTSINALDNIPNSKLILRQANNKFMLTDLSIHADEELIDIIGEKIMCYLNNEA